MGKNSPLNLGGKSKTEGKPAKDVGSSTVADKAFKMLFAGTLSEKALLAAAGVGQSNYAATEHIKILALDAFEEDKLSEDGLMRALNGYATCS